MLDTYLFGTVHRMSPEAPVPVVNIEKKESRPGGAANVAMNIKSLGGKVTLCTTIGDDAAGKNLAALLKQNKLLSDSVIRSNKRITTEKTRIFSRNRQMLRYDLETETALNKEEEEKLLNKIQNAVNSGKFNVVVFQDYNKGVLTKKIIRETIALCRRKKIPTAVDPKKLNFFEYRDVTLFKPNLRETADALETEINKSEPGSLKAAAGRLSEKLNHSITLITLSESGAFVTNHRDAELIPASVLHVADVSGAGDTVLSVAALCLACGIDFKTRGRLANIAGGIVCGEVGVAQIHAQKFFEEAKEASS